MNGKRPTIGFFTCHLDNDYALEICRGVEYAARETDTNLIIFPGMYLSGTYDDPINSKYDYQYNSIYCYANEKTLDGIIVSIGSVGSFLSMKDKNKFLSQFNVPILTLEIEVPGYPYLHTENSSSIKDMVSYLIHDCGRKNIGFVSGRLDNKDAEIRYYAYKEALRENGIPYDENKVAYGNLSQYCVEAVSDLLDRCPELDAIMFANDTMAIGGYEAMRNKGIAIGKDILCTGFDNSITSMSLNPPLTTVDSHILDLGYNSIYQMLELLNTGKTSISTLEPTIVKRESTMYSPENDKEELDLINKSLDTITAKALLKKFKLKYMQNYMQSFYSGVLFEILDPLFLKYINIALGKRQSIDIQDINHSISNVMNSDIIKNYVSYSMFSNSITLLFEFLLSLDIDPEKKTRLSTYYGKISSSITNFFNQAYFEANNDKNLNAWSSVFITKDTLLTSDNEEYCFKLMMDKIKDSGFDVAYIYLYDNPIIQLSDGFWKMPDNLLFEAYLKSGQVKVLSGNDRFLPSSMIFNNKYTENNQRHTMILTPLFTNDEHHGLFICEADPNAFNKIYSTSLQLGTSLKFIAMMKQQLMIQQRLEQTMAEISDKNDLLNNLSITDALTGLLNRRGFFDTAQYEVTLLRNVGKRAIITYIDMDNLKQVNDIYGHKEGDFSLRSIAEMLRECLPKDAIIGRLGGDEFIALSFVEKGYSSVSITRNFEKANAGFNASCKKPYFVEFSYGFNNFVCKRDINIEEVMIKADSELYVNKKNKRKSVTKSENA